MNDGNSSPRPPDEDVLREYGSRWPASWVGLRFEGSRLVGYFTDPERHEEALLALVERPETLEIRRSAFSRSYLQSVYSETQRTLSQTPGCWSLCSQELLAVRVALRGGFEGIARELDTRYGAAVKLSVGVFPFPIGYLEPTQVRPAPLSDRSIDPVHVEIFTYPQIASVKSILSGFVRVSYESNLGTSLSFNTDEPAKGMLLNKSGEEVVGTLSGFTSGVDRTVHVSTGLHALLKFVAGTESLDPRLGTALPIGTYKLVVELPLFRDRADNSRIVTDAVSIELTADRGFRVTASEM